MRRTLLLSAGAAALAVTLAACGDSDDDATTTTSGSPDGEVAGASLEVGAFDDLTFDQDSYEVEAGEIAVTYVNEGSIAHTLLVEGVDGFKLSVGDEDSGTVTLEPGDYTLYCDVAGHQSAGMEADLTVS